MDLRNIIISGVIGAATIFSVTVAAQSGPATPSSNATNDLPAGEGRDLLVKECIGCHQLNVVTNQHKTASGWTDTIVEMRNRGANGSDADMEKILRYLTANFGPGASGAAKSPGSKATEPATPGASSSSSPASSTSRSTAAVASSAAPAMILPPKKPLPTPEQVVNEHFAALNACDWNRMMAQYDDKIAFLSKDGAIVSGREAIGRMFQKALQPPSGGGQCGMTLVPERTIVVGDTVNILWRADAPFFAETYRGSEAFETHNGLLVVQVTTWDPSAIKLKQ